MDNPSQQPPSLDAARQAEAKRFARIRRYLSFLDYLLGSAFLVILVFTNLSTQLIAHLTMPAPAGAVIYFLGLMAAYALITAPLDYITGYILPRRYGLLRQTLSGWLADHMKSAFIGLAFGSALVALAYWLLSVTPLWWLWGWVIVMLVSLVLSVLAPVLILPIFFETTPLPEGEVKQRLLALAGRAGIKVKGIYSVEFSTKTTAANAALIGLGSTRRIIISDTMLDKYTPPEIDVVMAHEMGHQQHRDMLRIFVFQGVVLVTTLWLSGLLFRGLVDNFGYAGLADPAALPLLVIAVGFIGIFSSPLLASFTRMAESQADHYALELTGDPDSFISAMSRLTDQNLAEAAPPRWVEVLLDDHPSYRLRLSMAERFKSGHPSI
jgi:Zn-dependent protease with chaperone function